MDKGMIFNIEEFAVHDGPGIRTVVFFKGCPLRCSWCHNPEGQNFGKQLMISKSSCLNCGKCRSVCSHNPCVVCGSCIKACPLRLRSICGRQVSVDELASELLGRKKFLQKNEGGVTISGGEPLAQPEFLLELLAALTSIHTVVETSGYAQLDVFAQVAAKVDMVLLDIKHTDAAVHKQVTGVGNELILKNLDYICRQKVKFRVRIPLIPGINDSREVIENICRLVCGSEALDRIELLPYNKAAGAKYPMVGKIYNPGFDTERDPKTYLNIIKKYNLRCVVL